MPVLIGQAKPPLKKTPYSRTPQSRVPATSARLRLNRRGCPFRYGIHMTLLLALAFAANSISTSDLNVLAPLIPTLILWQLLERADFSLRIRPARQRRTSRTRNRRSRR